MKYLTQFFWILLFCALGELLQAVIPFPIPAAIYGLVLLFLVGVLLPYWFQASIFLNMCL